MKQQIFIIRGLPGSGKTTLAEILSKEGVMHAADDFFTTDDGSYNFDASKSPEAHSQCLARTKASIEAGEKNIVVHNTFTQRWEFQPYLALAEEQGCRITVISTYDGGCTDKELAERNVHKVPVEVIQKMRNRWEHDWKNAKKNSPWHRKSN